MKNPTYLIILLALGLVAVSYKWIESASTDPVPSTADSTGNPTIETIMTRTSVRSYTDRALTEGQIDTLLRAAMAAPSAVNKQPWRFVVVTDTATLAYIADNFNSMKMARKAPAAIVMCGDMGVALDGEGRDYWVQDVSAASENLLLAAHAIGLGAVWCGIYPISDRVSQFSQLLALPDTIIPMACICVGYPDGNPTPKDKWVPSHIHHNKW